MPITFNSQQSNPSSESDSSSFLDYLTTPIFTALSLLDIPGDYVRGAIGGEFGDRLNSKQLLQSLGYSNPGFFAELGTGIVTDPLTFIGFGATKAAREAGTAIKTAKEIEALNAFGGQASRKILPELTAKFKAITGVDDTVTIGQFARKKIIPERALRLEIPFTSVEKAIPGTSGLSQTLATLGEKTKTFIGSLPITKYLSTAKQTEAGELLNKLRRAEDVYDHFESNQIFTDLENTIKSQAEKTGKSVDDINRAIYENAEDIDFSKRAQDYIARATTAINDKTAKRLAAAQTEFDIINNDASLTVIDKASKLNTLKTKVANINKVATDRLAAIHNRVTEYQADISKRLGFINQFGQLPQDATTEFKKFYDELFTDLKDNYHVDIEHLNDLRVSYIKRPLTRLGAILYDKVPALRRKIVNILTGDVSLTKDRIFANKTVEQVNAHLKKEFGLAYDVLAEDPILAARTYKYEYDLLTNKINTVKAAVHLGGTVVKKGDVAADNLTSLGKIFHELKLNGFRFADGKNVVWGADATPAKIQKALIQAGATTHLDSALYADLARKEIITQSNFIKEIIAPLNTVYRTAVLSLPPFNIQHIGTNILGNFWVNLIAGVGDPRLYIQASQEISSYLKRQKTSSILSKLGETATTISDDLVQYIAAGAGGKNLTQEIVTLSDVTGKGRLAKLARGLTDPTLASNIGTKAVSHLGKAHYTINNFIEEVSKYAHYLGKRRQGLTPIDAAESVRRYLFDYSDLTEFEKKVLRPAVFFYTFQRKMIPLGLQEVFINKRAYVTTQSINRLTKDDDDIPTYAKHNGYIDTGNGNLLDLKIPFFEANKFGAQGGGIARVFDRLVNQISPVFRYPYEYVTQRDTFKGVDLSEVTKVPPRQGEILRKLGLASRIETDLGYEYRMNSFASQLLRALPTSRYGQLANKFIDNPALTISGLFGPRFIHVDRDLVRLQERQREIKQRLSNNKLQVRKYEAYYAAEKNPDPAIERDISELRSLNTLIKERLHKLDLR